METCVGIYTHRPTHRHLYYKQMYLYTYVHAHAQTHPYKYVHMYISLLWSYTSMGEVNGWEGIEK